MESGSRTLDAATVLGAAREARREANAAETKVMVAAIDWAHLHVVDDLEDAATWWVVEGRDTGIPIAGEGCPLVSEFAIGEFATALGLTEFSGRNLIAQALELAHRLPKTWSRVQTGQLAPWQARKIAEKTLPLSFEAAAWVDAQVAPFAHKTGITATERLVETATAMFMPAYAAEQRERSADQRYFTVDHHQVSFAGTSRLHGELDLADALDVEDAVTTLAQRLADLGSTDTLEARRAAALGMLARGEQPFDLQSAQPAEDGLSTGPTTEPERSEAGRVTRKPRGRRRDVVLYVHLSEDALRSHDPDAPVRVENAGGQLLTAGQVAEWCGRPDTDRIVVKPVRDLTSFHHPEDHHHDTDRGTEPYRVSAQMAEDVELRDSTCVFPWCTRPARGCDKDHIVSYDRGGPTCPCNLAPLCRLHHRMKTHGGWTYTMVEQGSYLWRSPFGYSYLRDQSGTEDLTPPLVDPPPRRTS